MLLAAGSLSGHESGQGAQLRVLLSRKWTPQQACTSFPKISYLCHGPQESCLSVGWDGCGALEQQTCTDSNLGDIRHTTAACLRFLTYEHRKEAVLCESGSRSAVWLNHVFVSFVKKKKHICNTWAHGMNPSPILNLVPKTAVFEDDCFGRKCVSGSPFHNSCQEAQKSVFCHIGSNVLIPSLSHACSFCCYV